MKTSTAQIKNRKESGQALLIVLLGMAVILTLVLSIVSRSVTDISLTKKDEESLRAFSAAEAGVEQILVGGPNATTFPNSSYSGNVVYIEGETYYNLVNKYYSGEVGTVWFVSHDASGNLTCGGGANCVNPANNTFKICWGSIDNTPPAIEVSLYYDTTGQIFSGNFANVKIARSTFDSDVTRRTNENFFGQGYASTCTFASGPTYNYTSNFKNFYSDLGLPAGCNAQCLLFAKIKMLYNSVPDNVGVALNNDTFPAQAKKVTSIGYSGEATRKVEAVQTFAEPLSIFDNAVFSNAGNLSK